VPTNRQRRRRVRIDVRVAPWVEEMLRTRKPPAQGSEGDAAWFGWLFCGDPVVGLPQADSEAGQRLIEAVGAYDSHP
jgi:hypothetical protein